MLHGARDVDSLSGGEVVLAIEAIREEEDARSVYLVIDDGDVAVVVRADAEGDGLSLGVAALPVGGGDLEVEVFVDLLDPALDFGLGGGAFLDGLGAMATSGWDCLPVSVGQMRAATSEVGMMVLTLRISPPSR